MIHGRKNKINWRWKLLPLFPLLQGVHNASGPINHIAGCFFYFACKLQIISLNRARSSASFSIGTLSLIRLHVIVVTFSNIQTFTSVKVYEIGAWNPFGTLPTMNSIVTRIISVITASRRYCCELQFLIIPQWLHLQLSNYCYSVIVYSSIRKRRRARISARALMLAEPYTGQGRLLFFLYDITTNAYIISHQNTWELTRRHDRSDIQDWVSQKLFLKVVMMA